MTDAEILAALSSRGFVVVPGAFSAELMERCAAAIDVAAVKYEKVHRETGYTAPDQGAQHHVLCEGGVFLDVLDALEPVSALEAALQGKLIVNSFASFDNAREKSLYVHRVHRDIRFAAGNRPLMLNLLVMVDEFSLENGATWVMPRSHLQDAKPADVDFRTHSARVTGPRGAVLLFDSRLWHAAGENTTAQPRRALTLTLTNPFFKPQFDYCRALGEELVLSRSEKVRQLVGWYARTPATLEEWYYRTPDKRFYRGNQDG